MNVSTIYTNDKAVVMQQIWSTIWLKREPKVKDELDKEKIAAQSCQRTSGTCPGCTTIIGSAASYPTAAHATEPIEVEASVADQQDLMDLTQYVDLLIGTSIPKSSGYQANLASGAQVPESRE